MLGIVLNEYLGTPFARSLTHSSVRFVVISSRSSTFYPLGSVFIHHRLRALVDNSAVKIVWWRSELETNGTVKLDKVCPHQGEHGPNHIYSSSYPKSNYFCY